MLVVMMLKIFSGTGERFWASLASVELSAKGEMGQHGREHERRGGDDLRV